jgi:hypothetical protein
MAFVLVSRGLLSKDLWNYGRNLRLDLIDVDESRRNCLKSKLILKITDAERSTYSVLEL